ncbi:MAG: glycan-binding surface protein [Bacteroidales bacterium]|nr:glycan-binding surface protein [Bacteroidales bacterium]
MKNRNDKSFWTLFIFLGLSVFGLLFNSCKDNNDEESNAPITIEKVYLEDAQSSVPDREVTFARLGQVLRIEGSGFTGVKKVYINGYDNYFNPVYITDNSMLVSISQNVPTTDAADNERNTIRLEKSASNSFTYSFEIRASAPTVTSISHTMPLAGDSITIYGTGLQGVTSVTFPGDVVVTEGIISDNDKGTFCKVIVPDGVSAEGGSLLVVGANGGAYSPACFNFRKGLYQNFDDVNNYAWASGIDNAGTALTTLIPASGNTPKSQGGYQCFNITGKSIAANSDVRYWTNSTNWPSSLLSVIPAGTATTDCGVQMDIYIEGEWKSGVIRMVMADGSGTNRYCMIYRPWYVNDAVVPFKNPGCWFTVTFPFSDSEDYEAKTFGDVVTSMVNASYKQSGPWFHNIGVTDVVEPVATDVKIYFDNLRVVPLNTPTYSDFPDDEE